MIIIPFILFITVQLTLGQEYERKARGTKIEQRVAGETTTVDKDTVYIK